MATRVKLFQLTQDGASNGQVATWDNTLGVWKPTTISGSGTSAGVTGSIQFSDGSGGFLADGTNFFWDDTANQLKLTGGSSYAIALAGQNGGISIIPTSSVTGAFTGMNVSVDATGTANLLLTNTNASSSTSNSRIAITTSAGGGDPYLKLITAEAGYVIGMDNSASDVLVIGLGTDPSNMSITNLTFSSNSLGVLQSTPTAKLHISGGTAILPPLKIDSGTALTTPADGALEYHGSHLYFTIGSTRYQLDQQGSGLSGGTSNYVTYWTGTSTLGADADFQFDGTSVGIGQAPSGVYRLAVTGGALGAMLATGALTSTGTGVAQSSLSTNQLRLINATPSTGDTWYTTVKNTGVFSIESSNFGAGSVFSITSAGAALFAGTLAYTTQGSTATALTGRDASNLLTSVTIGGNLSLSSGTLNTNFTPNTGSGTTNHVAFWSGTNVLSSDTDLQFNGTEVGMGGSFVSGIRLNIIGTGATNASTALAVHDSSGSSNTLIVKNDSKVGILNASPIVAFDVAGSTAFGTSTANTTRSPRTFNVIDANAVARIWRYTSTTSNSPAVELIWGNTGDTATTAGNYYWDFSLITSSSTAEGFLLRKRTGGSDVNIMTWNNANYQLVGPYTINSVGRGAMYTSCAQVSTAGDSQVATFSLVRSSTSTSYDLLLDNGSVYADLDLAGSTNRVWGMTVLVTTTVTARTSGTPVVGDVHVAKYIGFVKKIGGVYTASSFVQMGVDSNASLSATTVAFSATTGQLGVTVTRPSGTATYRSVAKIELVDMGY